MVKSIIVYFLVFIFVITGFFALFDQYLHIGIWFQIADVHHETLALVSFALAIGFLFGSLFNPSNTKGKFVIRKSAMIVIFVNLALLIMFCISVFYQAQLFSQIYNPTVHLTRSNWGFFSFYVQDFYYDYNVELLTSNPISNQYPNYPPIILFIFFLVNTWFAFSVLRKSLKSESSAISRNAMRAF